MRSEGNGFMSDEQTIYISPADDLTTVRERIEQIPARRITLVIPDQTQLRSHVAWRNLYLHARELGKEILIISRNAQIRSVAQAAKFRVAHSLEATPTGKSRVASRPGRGGAPARNRAAVPAQQRSIKNSSAAQDARDMRGVSGTNRPRSSGHIAQWDSPAVDRSPITDITEQAPESNVSDAAMAEKLDEPTSFAPGEQHYNDPYALPNSAPPIVPLSPEQMVEEPDLLLEDFKQAQNIRRAARQDNDAHAAANNKRPLVPQDESMSQTVQEPPPTYRMTPLPDEPGDPFVYMEDSLSPSLPEQLGSASIEGFDTGEHIIHDASERPIDTNNGEIEYQGDLGNFVIHSDSPRRSWSEPSEPIQEDEQDTAGPARSFGMRRGRINRGPLPPLPLDLESEDDLPPVEDMPTQVTPPPAQPQRTKPRSTELTSTSISGRTPQQAPAIRNRASLSRPAPRQVSQRDAGRTGMTTGTRIPPRSASARRATAQRRDAGSSGALVILAIILLLLLVVGSLAYFGPSADVTLTLFSRDFSTPVKLLASPTTASGAQKSQGATNAVPATPLTKTFNQSGTGKATGSAKVGTAKATGTVTFTNNGGTPVDIPSGIIVSTSTGVQFATAADAVANVNGNVAGNTVLVPVQAQKPGESGNVPAGSITLIPDDSMSAIAKNNNIPAANLKLLVTNTAASNGGGAGIAPAVSATDLNNERADLRAQLDTSIATWLKSQLAPGDVASTPTKTETVVGAPQENQVVDNSGTFNMTMSIHARALVVRNATIQQASVAQLNGALNKERSSYVVVSGAAVGVSQLKTTGDDNALTLNFTATGKTVPRIDKQQVQNLIKGKSIQDAQTLLKTQVPNVENAAVNVSPGFVNFVPWWSGHINVKIVPGRLQPLPPVKNNKA